MLLRKGVYPYEDKDDWEKFSGTTLPEKKNYSNLIMVDITDTDYMYAKRISKNSEVKNLCEYHYLYLKTDAFLLANVFKNFRNICLKIYHLYPVKTSFDFWISMARSFNKD